METNDSMFLKHFRLTAGSYYLIPKFFISVRSHRATWPPSKKWRYPLTTYASASGDSHATYTTNAVCKHREGVNCSACLLHLEGYMQWSHSDNFMPDSLYKAMNILRPFGTCLILLLSLHFPLFPYLLILTSFQLSLSLWSELCWYAKFLLRDLKRVCLNVKPLHSSCIWDTWSDWSVHRNVSTIWFRR